MIMMGLGCMNVSRKGEIKETKVKLSIDGNAKKE
jgi:hypothetical protein